MEQEVELVIIGGGPAGTSAGVYAARKRIPTTLIVQEFGGQSVVSEEIHNWIGIPAISGADLAKSFEKHLDEYKSDIFNILKDEVIDVKEENNFFFIKTSSGKSIKTRALLITSGSVRRKLNIPGSDEFENKGLTYCASCDGPLFADKDVAVIGGGNAGFESAAQLLAYTSSVTLLHKNAEFKADKITVDKTLSNPKMKAITNVDITEVFGNGFVKGLKYKENNEEKTLNVEGIFVEIGLVPMTEFIKDLVELDNINRIKVDPYTQQSSHKMIWAAGDCSDVLFHQNNIAAGDAVKAIEHIYLTLHKSK